VSSAAGQRARKGEPFSVRFSLPTDHLVEDEARRTSRSKSAIVEALTEEAVRTRRFPGIGFRGEDAGRRPWVIGSGLDVWEIVQMLQDFGSVESLVEQTQLSERQVRLALVYSEGYPEEIAEAIAENRPQPVRRDLRGRRASAAPAASPGAVARHHSRVLSRGKPRSELRQAQARRWPPGSQAVTFIRNLRLSGTANRRGRLSQV
jgi:uncharacterized protein (DUF433 family)